ncbi:MAG: acetylglutamate kinase [Cyclobacteriaceae bacterium]
MTKEVLYIVKVGGQVVNDSGMMTDFLASFQKLEGLKILVHGGGKLATQLASDLGVPVTMIDGRRVTDQEVIRIVTMAYAGEANKRIVAQLQALGCNALGLTGADGNLIESSLRAPLNGIDYGLIGEPNKVNTILLNKLLSSDFVPVIAPLTHDKKGQLLNLNADTIASTLAKAMSTLYDVSLIYAFELTGVLKDIADPSSMIKSINRAEFEDMKMEKIIHSGMLPKLENALTVVESGVGKVGICKYDKIGEMAVAEFNEYTRIYA